MGGEKFEEAYGAYGKFSYFSQGADLPDVAAVDVYDLKAPVPLDGYTLLLPESVYYYYQDRFVVAFYEDDSRKKELLRCEIVARLDSSNPEKLVYRNDKYLAVFDSITDYHHIDEALHSRLPGIRSTPAPDLLAKRPRHSPSGILLYHHRHYGSR